MPDAAPHPAHVIIAGFGIVGRAVAEALDRLDRPYCVVELNAQTVTRCTRIGVSIIEGDVREEAVLQRAGIATASTLALAMPDEQQTLAALQVARRLNPTIRILARCTFTSAGLQAHRLGADAVVVAEQVVAMEFARVLEASLLR
jgi:CPA2 family monovalent cation:H+ antiporter-2